jgi:hypothetical protein
MTFHGHNDVVVLKENSEWLRYVFWGAAFGMCFLVVNIINAPDLDYGKLYGSVAGALLLGFCGFVLKIRRITIDPVKRIVTIDIQGFRQSSIDRIKIDDIQNILVFMVPDTYEDSNGRSRPCKSWSIALALKDRKVTLNQNPLTQKQASDISSAIQKLIQVEEIAENTEEAIMTLLQDGRKIDAIKFAASKLGLTLKQAKDFVEKLST